MSVVVAAITSRAGPDSDAACPATFSLVANARHNASVVSRATTGTTGPSGPQWATLATPSPSRQLTAYAALVTDSAGHSRIRVRK